METLRPPANTTRILVEHEISIRDEPSHGLLGASRRPSVVSVISSLSDVYRDRDHDINMGTTMATTTSLPSPRADGSPLCLDEIQRHPDVMEDRLGNLLDQRRDDDSLRYLIEFLRKTPPPENYMSIPDPQSLGRLHGVSWKALPSPRQRKRLRKNRPPIIKLPDSAVAAKTIGGHRHIAISIPLEYSHLTPLSTSQYPVFDSISAEFQREIDAKLGPLHSTTWDHTGTRLHTIGEDRESMASAPVSPNPAVQQERGFVGGGLNRRLSQNSDQPQALLRSSKGVSVQGDRGNIQPFADFDQSHVAAHPPNSRPISQVETKRRSMADMASDTRQGSQPRNEPSVSRNVTAKRHARNKSYTSTTSSALSSRNSLQFSPPSRRSSRRGMLNAGLNNSLELGESIDNVISSRLSTMSARSRTDANMDLDQHAPKRRSFAESLLSTDSVPNVLNAQSAKAYQHEQVPIVVRPPSRPGTGDARPSQVSVDGRSVGVQVGSPDLAHRTPASTSNQFAGAPLIERPKSRKDKVRERKARDMEALKALRDQSGDSAGTPSAPKDTQVMSPDSPVLGHFNPIGKISQTPLVEPEAVALPNISPQPATVAEESAPELPPLSPARQLRSSVKRQLPTVSNASSDISKPASPVNWDRASSQRRRERQAEREVHPGRRERYIAEALAGQKELADRMSRQELVLRYENLKEMRTFDMEKRLRRLERNGEVWLRSMVPLMDNLNRLLQEQYSIQRAMHYPPYAPVPAPRQPSQSVSRHHQPTFQTEADHVGPRVPWSAQVDSIDPSTNYSLRSVRSHESPLGAPRPRSAQPPRDIRTSKLRSPTLTAVGTRADDSRASNPWSNSPLQQEVDRAVTEQRARERIDDEIDALLRARENVYHPRRAANRSIGRISLTHLHNTSTSSFSTTGELNHTEFVTMADDTTLTAELLVGSLHQMEPLMQELAESARVSRSNSDASMGYDQDDWDLTPQADRNLYAVY